MHKIIKLYDSIRLNLGIKKFIWTHVLTEAHINWFDLRVLYPLNKLLNEYFFTRIVYHYGADYHWGDQKSQNLDTHRYNYGYGQIHHAFIRNQRPKRILCIGSMYGYIPFMMALACAQNDYGQVDFVDAGYDIDDTKSRGHHYFGQGFWKKINPNEHFSYLGVEKHINTYVKTSAQFAKEKHEQYDYIYLDGDHSYQGATQNIKLFWPKLNLCGFLCIHDIHFDRIAEGVRFEHGKMWHKLSFMPYKFELSNHYSGLGFIQKLGNKNPLKEIIIKPK